MKTLEESLAQLRQALHEYLLAVPRQSEPDAPDLLEMFEQLDSLEKHLDPDAPAQLRHYLHQKSYRKAHLFLENREAENLRGSCGR